MLQTLRTVRDRNSECDREAVYRSLRTGIRLVRGTLQGVAPVLELTRAAADS